jgi:phosphoribosyl 1,2-cyclic phosphodiesterase
MKICCLASGSKGNSTYIETNNSKILIDCGLPIKDEISRLSKINVNPCDINAVFITHEHCDHIKGLSEFTKRSNCLVYAHINEWPFLSKKTKIDNKLRQTFNDNEFVFKDLTINSTRLSHDSGYCVGYSFKSDNQKVSIVTDLGVIDESVINLLKGSDIIIIESNHDDDMLLNNDKYPAILKRRILSNKGHLSNSMAASAILELSKYGTKQFILAHLSESNNTPDLAYTTIKNYLEKYGVIEGKHIFIDVAYQNEVGTLFNIEN